MRFVSKQLTRATRLTLIGVTLACAAAGWSGALSSASAAHAEDFAGLSITADSPVYAAGDHVQFCYTVLSPGQVTITDNTSDNHLTVLYAAHDDGSGGCLQSSITQSDGQECLGLDFTADDPTTPPPMYLPDTCFQTLPQGAIAQFYTGGRASGYGDMLTVYADGHATEKHAGQDSVTLQLDAADVATLQSDTTRFASFIASTTTPLILPDGGVTSVFLRGRGTEQASQDEKDAASALLHTYVSRARAELPN